MRVLITGLHPDYESRIEQALRRLYDPLETINVFCRMAAQAEIGRAQSGRVGTDDSPIDLLVIGTVLPSPLDHLAIDNDGAMDFAVQNRIIPSIVVPYPVYVRFFHEANLIHPPNAIRLVGHFESMGKDQMDAILRGENAPWGPSQNGKY